MYDKKYLNFWRIVFQKNFEALGRSDEWSFLAIFTEIKIVDSLDACKLYRLDISIEKFYYVLGL